MTTDNHDEIMRAIGRLEGTVNGLSENVMNLGKSVEGTREDVVNLRVSAAQAGKESGTTSGAASGGLIALGIEALKHLAAAWGH